MRLATSIIILLFMGPGIAIGQDTDGDGVADGADNCITEANPDQCDFDGDGFGNHCDGDFNQNGDVDSLDQVAFDSAFGSAGSNLITDLDCNGFVQAPDSHLFVKQVELGTPGPSGLLCAGVGPCIDGDRDGIPDHADNCPDHTDAPNALQCDTDQDGFGNVCDADYDNEGSVQGADFTIFAAAFGNGPDVTGQGTDHNCDGNVNGLDYSIFAGLFGDPVGPSSLPCAGSEVEPCTDGDRDAVPDFDDNCPGAANASQSDSDGDGDGDACDPPASQDVALVADIDSKLQIVRDSTGRLHGAFVTAVEDGQGGIFANQAIVYVSQDELGGPLSARVVQTASPLGSASIQIADVALDSAGRLCILWRDDLSPGDARRVFEYGCIIDGALATEPISGGSPLLNLRSLRIGLPGGLDLEIDAAGNPHIVAYQHAWIEGDDTNHRIRHFWRQGGLWYREVVPLSADLEQLADAASERSCMVIDDANQMHIGLDGDADNIPSNIHHPRLVHSVKDLNTGQWSSNSTIRDPAGNGPVPSADQKFHDCEIEVDANGFAQIGYLVGNEWFHSKNSAIGWQHRDLGVNPIDPWLPTGIVFDSLDNAFALHPDRQRLVRALDTGGAITASSVRLDVREAYESWDSSGRRVFVDPAPGGGTVCTIVHARPREEGTAGLSDVLVTRIERCDEAFATLTLPDYEVP